MLGIVALVMVVNDVAAGRAASTARLRVAMLDGMDCPFCGDEMRRGWVRARGVIAAGPWASTISVNFEVMDGSGEGSVLVHPGWLGRGRRRARCCVGCEAVVVDPKAEADPNAEARRQPGSETDTEDAGD